MALSCPQGLVCDTSATSEIGLREIGRRKCNSCFSVKAASRAWRKRTGYFSARSSPLKIPVTDIRCHKTSNRICVDFE